MENLLKKASSVLEQMIALDREGKITKEHLNMFEDALEATEKAFIDAGINP